MESEFIILQGKKFKLEPVAFFMEKELPVKVYRYRNNNLTETLNKHGRRTSMICEVNNIQHGITVFFLQFDVYMYDVQNNNKEKLINE